MSHLKYLLILSACLIASSAFATEIEDFSADLVGIVQDANVPAIAAAVVVDGEIVAHGASGIRKIGSTAQVQVDDKFHLGSCTKAMTATLAAIHVNEQLITWDSTVEEIFKGVHIHDDYKKTTLKQLLSNTGGCPTDVEGQLWSELWQNKGSTRQQRMQLVVGTLKRPPRYIPGAGHEYSNTGFSIAGAMLERVAKKPYEVLMQEKLFKPLGMSSAGFRAPASRGQIDQPYGHNPAPVDPEPRGDNPRCIAPAGAVHCSLADWVKFSQLHMNATQHPLLNEADLKLLQTTVSKEDYYAMGWGVGYRPWTRSEVLSHLGSNTMFYSSILVVPQEKFALLIATNIGGEVGEQACKKTEELLLKKFARSRE